MSGFSFDDAEFGVSSTADDTAMEEAAGEVVSDMDETPETSIEELDREVEKRFEVAMYYRLLLNDAMFTTVTEASRIVETEVRAFIRERLEILMGMRQPRPDVVQVESPFTEEETTALKALASKVLGKPAILQPKTDPKPAIVKKTAQEPPKVAPKPTPPAPGVKKRDVPGAKKAMPPAPAPKKKVVKQAQAKPVNHVDNPETQTVVRQNKDGSIESTEVLVEGETIEEHGRKFIVSRNELGTLYKRDVTGQVTMPGRLPQITPQQLSLLSERQAAEQVKSAGEMTQLAILTSLKQGE